MENNSEGKTDRAFVIALLIAALIACAIIITTTPLPAVTRADNSGWVSDAQNVGGEIVPINISSVLLSQYSIVIALLIVLSIPLAFLFANRRNKN
jgi:hypothetical protein